jgi:hypothetical protein
MWRGDVMRIPVIRGVIDRRILVNYRVDAEVLASVLPAPFRPKVVRGVGMVGICLIRLKGVGPRFFPVGLGVSSENAAHRAAVEWDDEGAVREGVFVRRRDTDSWLNTWAGGCFRAFINTPDSWWMSRRIDLRLRCAAMTR